MSELERRHKPFEISVGGQEIVLMLGNCAVSLFYEKPEVDYIAYQEGDTTLRIFNNEDLVRWMAGFCLQDSVRGFRYPHTMMNDKTFREVYGWNPTVLVRHAPNDDEEQWFTEVNVSSIDNEWEHFLDEE